MVSFHSDSHLHPIFPATLWCFSFIYIFVFFSIFIATFAAHSEDISYNAHCSSFIPQAATTTTHNHAYVEFPYIQSASGYLTGGSRLFPSTVILSPTSTVLETTVSGVYRVEAELRFLLPYHNLSYVGKKSRFFRQQRRPGSSSLDFGLKGFWSEPSGKLCMVGRAPWQSEEGESIELEGVLKLNFAPKNSTIFTSLTKGSLQSVSDSNDPRYFEPVKIVYFYSSIAEYDFKLESGCVGGDVNDDSQSLSLNKGSFCSAFWGRANRLALQYASDCVDRENCSPLGRDIAYLPQSLSMDWIQCFEEKEKVRILMKFSNWSRSYGEFDTRTALLGEGSWDWERNQMCIVACKILHPNNAPADAYVDDCSTRLSFKFPAIQTIENTTKIAGEIWTNKTTSEPGYFKSIRFSGSNYYYGKSLEQKYVYTQVGLVQHSCYANKPSMNGNRYPNPYSRDMRFDIFVEESNERIARGHAAPISVGDKPYQRNTYVMVRSDEEDNNMEESFKHEGYSNVSKPIKISYKISIFRSRIKSNVDDQMSLLNASHYRFGHVDITAEGFYNPQTGVLCMVGCRELISDKKSDDCEILVNIELPPLYSRDKIFGEGFLSTKREDTDPLYFKRLNITLASINTMQAMRVIRRVNLEIIMALVSNTFSVIFLALQIFYVKKHPKKLPFVSILMLGILALGHLIPLVLNFGALILKNWYQQNVILQATGWLEVKELSVRVITLVAVFLNFRLLQLAWTSRLREENGYTFWNSELKAIYVSFPIYLIGVMINLFGMYIASLTREPPSSIFKYISSYTGLIHDGYLLPQIIFNVFQNSRESALSPLFYIGTTLVRLLPHAYDHYRIHYYIDHQDLLQGVTYVHGNHTRDFYSKAWDVIIPCVCVLLAVIIFLQQRFGGDVIVPKKYKEVQLYEKVPVETDE